MKTNPEIFLPKLKAFFEAAPPGYYHPAFVRKELGLCPDQWKYLAKSQVYPASSKGRCLLSEVNTEVTERLSEGPLNRFGERLLIKVSTFVKHGGPRSIIKDDNE